MNLHFYLRTPSADTSSLQLVVTHKGKRFRYNIGITVDTRKWNARKEKSGNVQIDEQLTTLRNKIETNTNAVSTLEEVKKAVEVAVLGEERKDDRDDRMPFWTYYKKWTDEAEHEHRVKGITFKLVARLMGTDDNWNDIDEAWHLRLMREMNKEGYSENYKTAVTKHLRGVLLSASRDGLYTKTDEWKKFKKRWETADTIYMTADEVDRLWNMELPAYLAHARDLFLLGVYSAARYQNYSKFTMNNIKGNNLDFVQIKTGERVVIPASPKLVEILKRNGGKAPSMSNQKLNTYIKIVCEKAGMTEEVEVRKHRGGEYQVKKLRRCDLVSSHTARRTGATLLYLSGVPITLCRFLTGHSSDEMFMRYIKIRREEAADKLRDNPFFK